ncbi:MAG: protein kinase [Gemmatimonadaceae bacterium]
MDTPDAGREDRIERLFENALALPPERRAAFLVRACGTDAELRTTLDRLVSHAREAHDFVDRVAGPAVARAAGTLLDDSPASLEYGADPFVGQRIAHFQILERLGGGGMGLVYKALDLRLDRTVALKFLPPHLGADEEATRRFIHEAKAASALDHPNICAIHEIGETDAGQLFIAMAYCEGETLKKKIARGPLSVSDALDYCAQIAEGLQRAHDAGIVHRDVKPANVMVTDGGRVKIVDFGLAKMAGTELTREGTTIGTVAYMSPEQTRGVGLDARTDVWSLGAVLYEMLTGQRPFRGESDETLIYAIRHDEPKPVRAFRPEIPAGLAALVSRCLDKDLARRYQRADEVLADLRATREGRAAARHPAASKRVLQYGSVAALFFLLILAGGTLHRRPAARVASLAVLPATVFTGDSAQEYFAEGMTDLLINDLSQLSGLDRVISRTSVTQYKGTRKSSRQIGRELGVDALVELSVLRAGERVRINVSLIAARAERVLWSRSFERPMRDVLTLQREVAQAIARELQVRLTPQEAARLVEAAPPVNPEAFALYLQGVRVDGDDRRAIAYFEQATEKDPNFALAYARLAVPHVMVNEKAEAERAIAKALELDPSLSEAYDALGLLRLWLDWDWPAAEAALRRSIGLNPHNSRAHHELGQLVMRRGRCDDAIAEEQRAMFSDPASARYQSGIAEVYLYCRRYAEARREFEKTLDLVRDSSRVYRFLGDSYFYEGQYQKALAMYERTREPHGWIYAAVGRNEEARRQLDSLKAQWTRGDANNMTAWNLARIYTSLGEREQAFTWLERTSERRDGMSVYLKVHPHFDPLRGEPRFQALLKKVRLTD